MEDQQPCPLWLAMLRQVPFLAPLPTELLWSFAGQVSRQRLKRGEYLYFESDPASMFYVVRGGRLKLLKIAESGRELIVEMAGPGEQAGVIDCLGERYTLTAQSQAAALVLGFPAATLRAIAQEHQQVAWTLLCLARDHLQQAHDQLQALATERVEQRLARALLRLARSGRRTPIGMAIDPPLSRYDLAQLCGTTTETVSRVISSWQRGGLVEAGRERIVVIGFDELACIAEEQLVEGHRPR